MSTKAGSANASSGVDAECEGEEPEDPSSSSHHEQDMVDAMGGLNLKEDTKDKNEEDELSLFRQQWQRELELTPTPQKDPEPKPEIVEPLNDEEKAKQLFLSGVELERCGKLYEAIQHYKRAMQIVPDIEARLYDGSELRADSPEVETSNEEVSRVENEHDSDDEDAVEGEDLLARLQRVMARKPAWCEPAYPVKGAHISWLPLEVLLLILRWVVSSELDAASLERVAGASRGLYRAARDHDLWRSLCVSTWGLGCGTPRSAGFASWRQMYVERPRLQFSGCYISKTTYLRHGENSFQDQFYRPWYLIDYYRYLRFFPDGLVLMWTTAEEPAPSVGLLKYRHTKPGLGIMAGHYCLIGDMVLVVIKKTSSEKKTAQASNTRFRARRKDAHEQHEQTFHMEFQLRTVRSRRNFQLAWQSYSACTRRDHWTQFELSPSKFPPFAFSCVRAYTAEAHAPLPCTYPHSNCTVQYSTHSHRPALSIQLRTRIHRRGARAAALYVPAQ